MLNCRLLFPVISVHGARSLGITDSNTHICIFKIFNRITSAVVSSVIRFTDLKKHLNFTKIYIVWPNSLAIFLKWDHLKIGQNFLDILCTDFIISRSRSFSRYFRAGDWLCNTTRIDLIRNFSHFGIGSAQKQSVLKMIKYLRGQMSRCPGTTGFLLTNTTDLSVLYSTECPYTLAGPKLNNQLSSGKPDIQEMT